MQKPATTDFPVHDLIRERWSPRAFADRPIDRAVLAQPIRSRSMGALQQQRATLGLPRRHERRSGKLRENCSAFSWNSTPAGPNMLPFSFLPSRISTSKNNGTPNRNAFYDIGAATALLTVEATARGLARSPDGRL